MSQPIVMPARTATASSLKFAKMLCMEFLPLISAPHARLGRSLMWTGQESSTSGRTMRLSPYRLVQHGHGIARIWNLEGHPLPEKNGKRVGVAGLVVVLLHGDLRVARALPVIPDTCQAPSVSLCVFGLSLERPKSKIWKRGQIEKC